jgi:hypothetical protein
LSKAGIPATPPETSNTPTPLSKIVFRDTPD